MQKRKSIGELLGMQRSETAPSDGGLQQAMQRGIAASENGDKEGAHAIFQQVAQQFPNSLEVWVWMGWTSPTLEGAEAAFVRARELDPSNEEAALGLRWVASQQTGDEQPAMQAVSGDAPVQSAPQPEQPSEQAVQMTETQPPAESYGQPRSSEPDHSAEPPAAIDEGDDQHPTSPILTSSIDTSTLHPTSTELGKLESSHLNGHNGHNGHMADTQYPDLATRQSTQPDVDVMLHSAIAAVQSGNKAGAHQMFEHLASLQSRNPDVWVWVGGTSDTLDDAEYAFRRAFDLDFSNEKAALGLRWVALRRQVESQAGGLNPGMVPYLGTGPLIGTQPDLVGVSASTEGGTQKKSGPFAWLFRRFSKTPTQ